jgi:hypothetical protein
MAEVKISQKYQPLELFHYTFKKEAKDQLSFYTLYVTYRPTIEITVNALPNNDIRRVKRHFYIQLHNR